MTMGGSDGPRHRPRRRPRRRRSARPGRRGMDTIAAAALANFKLTPRQTDVLGLLLRGQSNKLIARELNLSVETVKDHVAAVLRALGVNSRTQAVLAVSQMSGQGSDRAMAHADRSLSAVAGDRHAGAARRRDGRGDGRRPARRRSTPSAPARPRSRPFAFNRTSLAGHLIGAVLIVTDLRRRRAAAAAASAGARASRWSGCCAWLAGLASPSASRRRRPACWPGCAPGRPACSSRARCGARPPGCSFPTARAPHQIALVLVVYTFCVAIVPILAPQFPLFVIFVPLVFAPAIARVVSDQHRAGSWQLGHRDGGGDGDDDACSAATTATRSTASSRLKLRTEALAEQLRAEKAVADAARHEAEIANRAKTQFFTAASHDLRQPLHAMGLFAEALRQRSPRRPRSRSSSTASTNRSTRSRACSPSCSTSPGSTAAGSRCNPQNFALARHLPQAAAAFRAGGVREGAGAAHPRRQARRPRRSAAGRAHPAQPGLERDPLHRTTARCWSAAGAAASGCCCRSGTPARASRADERARIFEEFYQVPGTRRGRRVEQKKGLGLGLAIVKRLAQLMAGAARAALAGRPRLGLHARPAARHGAAHRGAARAPGKGPIGITLDGRLIVIVEDEPAVREGLEVLLTGWGASIVSLRRASARRAPGPRRADPQAAPPALVIADYRLEHGETGVAAIDLAARSASAAALPAIVVTGSSMTGHDKEALEHDFHLLIKPVLPNKLRAMIAFKLGRAEPSSRRSCRSPTACGPEPSSRSRQRLLAARERGRDFVGRLQQGERRGGRHQALAVDLEQAHAERIAELASGGPRWSAGRCTRPGPPASRCPGGRRPRRRRAGAGCRGAVAAQAGRRAEFVIAVPRGGKGKGLALAAMAPARRGLAARIDDEADVPARPGASYSRFARRAPRAARDGAILAAAR